MKLSRRSFLEGSSAVMVTSSIVRRAAAESQRVHLGRIFSPQSSVPGAISKFVVEDFSRQFDPAYLSNGLIGIRPGPNPLAKARTQVSGFVFSHVPFQIESLSPAPYPLETDIRINGISSLKHSELVRIQRQTLDMSCGELATEMTFAPGNGVTLNIQDLQFASRSVPCLLCQELQVSSSARAEIEFVLRIDHEGRPGQVYLAEPPERSRIDLVSGFVSGGNLSKLGIALVGLTPDGPTQTQDPLQTETSVNRSYVLRA
jgi:hypothetical protein